MDAIKWIEYNPDGSLQWQTHAESSYAFWDSREKWLLFIIRQFLECSIAVMISCQISHWEQLQNLDKI